MDLSLPHPSWAWLRVELKEYLVLEFVLPTESESEFPDRRQRWGVTHFYIHRPMQVLNKVYSLNAFGLITFSK